MFISKIIVHAVAQLVETLRYKSEGRGFDSRHIYIYIYIQYIYVQLTVLVGARGSAVG